MLVIPSNSNYGSRQRHVLLFDPSAPLISSSYYYRKPGAKRQLQRSFESGAESRLSVGTRSRVDRSSAQIALTETQKEILQSPLSFHASLADANRTAKTTAQILTVVT